MRYLITGNTGFKGSWLSLMLKYLGNEVYGLALTPNNNSLYNLVGIKNIIDRQDFVDIRDQNQVEKYFRRIDPDFIFHLAAQPLVQESYKNPRLTIETNAMGTFNVLEATQNLESIKGVLIVTTDKVYKNYEQIEGYKEENSLGGQDPYSASKAMADIITHSWAKSFAKFPVVTARAGNVIGGGDFSQNRLIPDIFESIQKRNKLQIRNPTAIRPWQHVLDCLNGYLTLANNFENVENGSAWNFGPDQESIKSVEDILNFVKKTYDGQLDWIKDENNHPHESSVLTLDSAKSKKYLQWKNKLDFEETLKWCFDWYEELKTGKSIGDLTAKQITEYFKL
jgi:CDP-glucose 4,6-dehydratase